MKYVLIGLLLACSAIAFSQDIITKKNGDDIKAKVTEITDAQVKYKKWESLDGPVYNIPISDVFMVKYENGKKDFFGNNQPVTSSASKPAPTTSKTVSSQPTSYPEKKYKGEIIGGAVMTTIGPLSLGSGIFLTLAGIGLNNLSFVDVNGNLEYYDGTGYIIGGAVLLASGVALTVAGPIELSKGLKHKRAALGQPVTMRFIPISSRFDNTFHAHLNQTKLAGISLNF